MRRLLGVGMALGLLACAAAEPRLEAQAVQQLIVKLQDGADASQPAVLARLSAHAGLDLAHVRAMAGSAHVLVTREPVADAAFAAAVTKLGELAEVQYAAPDRRRHHQ